MQNPMIKKSLFPLKSITLATLFALSSLQAVYAEEAVKAEEVEEEYTFLESIKTGKSLSSVRARYEHVDQDGFQGQVGIPLVATQGKKLKNANAFTTRTLLGWQTAPFNNFSFAAQLTDVHEFNDESNDRRENQPEHNNGTALSSAFKRQYANIVDPGYTDINQLFVEWTGIKNTKLKLGRQIVNLDNVRFIGDIAFRQNTQVFDGISVVNKTIPDTEIFAAHFSKVRQVNTALRDGNIDLVNIKYRWLPTESITGYGYFVDVANLSQNGGNPNAAVGAGLSIGNLAQGGNGLGGSSDIPASATNVNPTSTDASSKTFGLRLDGVHVIDPNWRSLYTLEYAKQDDYRGGSPLIDAHYLKVGGGVAYNVWSLRLDYEKLSSNDGKYGFQTPLGTNHLFQGWADHFLVTPRQGMEDLFLTFGGKIDKAVLYAEYHVFKSDEKFETLGSTAANRRFGDRYGTEFDASVMYPFNDNVWAKIEYAKFNEDDQYGPNPSSPFRKGDKEIVWLTTQLTF
jgi:Alginate export